MTTTKYSFGNYNVSLALDADAPLGELEDLHICHLGMKFTSARQVPEFSIYEFEIGLRPAAAAARVQVKCCGIVVSCEPVEKGFHTVIHFSGLAKEDAHCLETLTKVNKMRCDYCANC